MKAGDKIQRHGIHLKASDGIADKARAGPELLPENVASEQPDAGGKSPAGSSSDRRDMRRNDDVGPYQIRRGCFSSVDQI